MTWLTYGGDKGEALSRIRCSDKAGGLSFMKIHYL